MSFSVDDLTKMERKWFTFRPLANDFSISLNVRDDRIKKLKAVFEKKKISRLT